MSQKYFFLEQATETPKGNSVAQRQQRRPKATETPKSNSNVHNSSAIRRILPKIRPPLHHMNWIRLPTALVINGLGNAPLFIGRHGNMKIFFMHVTKKSMYFDIPRLFQLLFMYICHKTIQHLLQYVTHLLTFFDISRSFVCNV